jgi:hypothetical protein
MASTIFAIISCCSKPLQGVHVRAIRPELWPTYQNWTKFYFELSTSY